MTIKGFGLRENNLEVTQELGKIGNSRGQGNQLKKKCHQNKGPTKDKEKHEKKIQKPEMFREKKEDLLILYIKDVEEYNR